MDDQDRDVPLCGSWLPDEWSWQERLRLPPLRRRKHTEARERILTQAAVLARADPMRWISYSRRPEFYAEGRRYLGEPLTYATVVPTVDQATQLELFEHEKAKPREPIPGQRGRQSRFRATERLREADKLKCPVVYRPPEIIIVRDCDGHAVPYPETDQTRRMRWRLEEINEALGATQLAFQGQSCRPGDVLPLPREQRLPACPTLHRVFNRRSFRNGGRMYGGWWQNVPSKLRSEIDIAGTRTVELDYPNLHPRLLYACAGVTMGGDAYTLPGWERKSAKIALNTLINADSDLSAVRAVALRLGGVGAYERARALITALRERHEPIAHMLGTCAGLRLMRIDSDMAESVERELMNKNVIALPIHDSFIVAHQHEDLLQEAMDRALGQALRRIIGKPRAVAGFALNVPQYGTKHGATSSDLLPANDNRPVGGARVVLPPESGVPDAA